MRTLKATNAGEAELLGGFLHDSRLERKDIVFDEAARRLIIRVRRVGYEWPKPTRLLGVIPAIGYPLIDAEIVIDGVVAVHEEWKVDAFDQPDDRHTLLEIRVEPNTVHVATEFLVLRLTLSRFSGILARDLGPPSERTEDWVVGEKPMFTGLAEITRLELDA